MAILWKEPDLEIIITSLAVLVVKWFSMLAFNSNMSSNSVDYCIFSVQFVSEKNKSKKEAGEVHLKN